MSTSLCLPPPSMHRYRNRGGMIRLFSSGQKKTKWDPTSSLTLSHPTLVLLEKCNSRDHFKQILGLMMRSNLMAETFPMSRLIYFSAVSHPYNIDMAVLLFNHFTPHPNLYIFNTLISALISLSPTQSFGLYTSMLKSFIYPDKHTLLYLLQASRLLLEVKQIHCHAIVTGLFTHGGYLQNSLLKMYFQDGQTGLAYQVFRKMPSPDSVSYNIMIVEYAKKGFFLKALEIFCEMLGLDLGLDEYTMTGVLMACGGVGDAELGKSVHAWLERRKLIDHCNLVLGNALLDMYVKCRELTFATRVFDMLLEGDVISWNTMIAGYAKIGELELAHTWFNRMPSRDLVSWNSLIDGYARRGDCVMVRKLFSCMIADNVQPDAVTVVSLVSAAAEVGALDQGRWIHGWLIRMLIKLDAFLGSALVDMYCKCGSIERALKVFRAVTEKDVTLLTTMITGLAFHGHGTKALEMFYEMQECMMPNHVTFVAVLSACSHSGLVDQGLRVFDNMKEKYGIQPRIEHYGCLVDLLARSGRLTEARDVIEKMSMKPSRSIWGALLNACRAHGDIEMAEVALRELQKLEPKEEGGYVLLSNLYASCGRWKYADNIREIMDNKGLKKTAGCSCVVVSGVIHEFVATDVGHPRWIEIQSILVDLKSEMELCSDALFDAVY